MLKVRLQRVGRKNDPSFRVVVTDSRRGPKSGNFIEILGSYDARQGKPNLKADRIKHWISVGAQTSGTVHNLLVSEGVIEGNKKNVLPKKSPIVKEGTEEVKAEASPEPEVEAEETKEETKKEETAAEEVTEKTEAPAEETPVKDVEETQEIKEESKAEEIKEEVKAEASPEPEAETEEVKTA